MSTCIFPHPYIDSSPVVSAGALVIGAWASGGYTSSTTGYELAVNAGNNTTMWRYPASENEFIGGVASTAAIFTAGGQKRVVFGSMDGKVYCLRLFPEGQEPGGSLVWAYQTTSSGAESAKILASPVVYEGRVYIGNESATVYCLNASPGSSTGECIWSQTFPRDAWPDRTGVSSVAIGPTGTGEMRAYVGSDNGYVYCLSIADNPPDPPGRKLWEYNAGACVESSPTVYAGNVYVGVSGFENVPDIYGLTADTGRLLWTKAYAHEVRATCAMYDAALLVGLDTGYQFYRLDATSGDVDPSPSSTNPFDAAAHRPDPEAPDNYFVGSAALDVGGDPESGNPHGFCLVGNDNYALYALSSADVSWQWTLDNGGIVCSSPAVYYTYGNEQYDARFVYVLSRKVMDGKTRPGRLFALVQYVPKN